MSPTQDARPLAGSLTSPELVRKLLHMGFGLGAFSLRFLGPAWGAVLAAAAVAHNLWLFPRYGGRRLWRAEETAAGRSAGMILYPAVVLGLVLLFWRRLEVAAAVWGILAFGDGAAALAGRALGGGRLPWNPGKTWAGSAAHLLLGAAAAAALLLWTAPGRYEPAFALAAAGAAALCAAALESLPGRLDDNLLVPPITGLFLLALLWSEGGWAGVATAELGERVLIGLAINGVLAAGGYLARGLDLSGALAGVALGTALWAFLGWRGFLLLAAFFVLGSAATRLGYRRKAAAGLAQEAGGRRSARHALANAAVGVACAVFAATTPYALAFTVACAAAFATAAADTAGSEIGQLLGRRTFLPTTLRRVPPGTEGAVSLEGTLAGVAAGLVVGGVGAAVGLYPWAGAAAVGAAAFAGTTLESLAGALWGRRGLLDNEAMNFLNTLAGAVAGFLLVLR